MPLGEGKYDALVEHVYRESGASGQGGLALVIVLDGKLGDGFSCKGSAPNLLKLPHLLRIVAEGIENDQRGVVNEMIQRMADRAMSGGSDGPKD